jgi:hypothetical protein
LKRSDRGISSGRIALRNLAKHTDWDLPEYVPDAGLAAVARAYAKIIDEVNEADRKDLPPGALASQK